MGSAIVVVVDAIFGLLMFLLLVTAIASWLVAFNVINPRNPNIGQILRMLTAMTEPMLRPIRRFVPSLGGVDISFIVLWLVLLFLRTLFYVSLRPILINTLG